jgi:pathogenesis-related protein 1
LVGFTLVVLGATGCVDEEDDGEPPAPVMTGSGGSSGASVDDEHAGSGGSGGTAMSADAGSGGSGGTMSGASTPDAGEEPPAASGETGIFVGATAAHNAIRDELSESEDLPQPLPDLTWSDALAVVAQDWADTLTSETCGSIGHRPNGRYGENIAARGSRGISIAPMGPDEAVQGWADEVECWTYGRITGGNTGIQNAEQCEPTCIAAKNSTGCGHYTQLVWANTRQVGCGYSTCTDDSDFLIEVWVCNYDPPGNVINQTPYQP